MKKIINKIKYWIDFWEFLKVYNSPLKGLKLVWYFGDIKIGHPYFHPRKWVKTKTGSKLVYLEYFGFDWNGLGWKTKWGEYRHEWSPSFSIIILGKQLNVTIIPDIDYEKAHASSYWEAWLYWNYRTDKTLPFYDRMISMFEQYGCTWTGVNKEVRFTNDHYLAILNSKYLENYKQWKNDNNSN